MIQVQLKMKTELHLTHNILADALHYSENDIQKTANNDPTHQRSLKLEHAKIVDKTNTSSAASAAPSISHIVNSNITSVTQSPPHKCFNLC